MQPLIDVVIPLYNGARTVESAIATIQAQTESSIRIIVVNDGSTDASRTIVAGLAASDPRIHIIDQENAGIVDALNRGLAAGTAPLIARHDADDLAAPDRFARQVAYLNANPDCIACAGAIRFIDENGAPQGEPYRTPSPDLANPERIPQLEPFLPHPFLMVRRAPVEAIGGYRHAFHAEDADLYWRLQEHGRLFNMPDTLGDYRIHAGSITSASLLNGRISAANSQRAGLSALRRRSGRPDLAFPKTLLADYKAARSLRNIIQAASRDLDAAEADRLTLCVCAKLLELASHRPYELELEDCAFIGKTLVPALANLTPESRVYCQRMLSGMAARLAAQGKVSAALHLAPMSLLPAAGAKLALRLAMPGTLRRTLRQAIRRDGFVR